MSRAALCSLVLCGVIAAGACSGEGASQGDVPSTSDTAGQPGDEEGTGTPPALTGVESRIVDALARLSLQAERAELPGPDGASVWVPETEPDPLQVTAYPATSSRGEVTVVDERQVGDLTVQTVEFRSGIVQRRFDCDGTTYGIGGGAPAGFDDVDAFLAAFVEALGCSA